MFGALWIAFTGMLGRSSVGRQVARSQCQISGHEWRKDDEDGHTLKIPCCSSVGKWPSPGGGAVAYYFRQCGRCRHCEPWDDESAAEKKKLDDRINVAINADRARLGLPWRDFSK